MIIFSGVSKQFGDQATGINHFSLQINDGEFLVITGPSGVGKTTLMKLLIREYEPSEGEIEIDGQAISQLKKAQIPELRRKIGVVFQDYKLINELNIWENIALPLYIAKKTDQEIEERVTDLLNLIELNDKALLFPRQLSGGEAQRVSIARALATGPKVIFADEPTGNLDAKASLMIADLLKKINQLGTTLLFATHDQLVLDRLSKEKIVKLSKPEPKPISTTTAANQANDKPKADAKTTADDKDRAETEEKAREETDQDTKKTKANKDKSGKKTKNKDQADNNEDKTKKKK